MKVRNVAIVAAMAVAGAVVVAGCTTTIKYTPSAELPVQGKTRLRAGVFDFADRTEGKHTMHWDDGAPWTYDNIGSVTADAVADALRNCGQFRSVERIRKEYTKEGVAGHSFDIAVAGEVKDFKNGVYPHPTVFINPICLGYFLGFPTVYGNEEGTCEDRIVIIDRTTDVLIEDMQIRSTFGPSLIWIGWPSNWDRRQKRGQTALRVFEAEFAKQWRQRLDGPLGQTLLAMDRSRATFAGSGDDLAAAAAIPTPPAAASTPTQVPNASATANRFALVVGISKYQHAGSSGPADLAFADDDARGFAESLKAQGWDEAHIKLLVNEQATKREIEKALDGWLTKAGANDLIVLFWAGHGFPDPEDPEKVYFACHDTEILEPSTGLRMDRVHEALKERGARNVVVLADTCHAGKLATRGDDRSLAVRPYIDKMTREQTVPKGWIYLCGAETDRQSVEHTSWRNGAFTHCLLRAMSGAADGCGGAPKDGVVTLGEIKEYLLTAMPDETQKVLGVAKRPFYATSSGDPEIWNLTLRAPKE